MTISDHYARARRLGLVASLACLSLAGCSQGVPERSQLLRQCENVFAEVYVAPHGSHWLVWIDGRVEPIAAGARLDDICTAPPRTEGEMR